MKKKPMPMKKGAKKPAMEMAAMRGGVPVKKGGKVRK